MTKATDLIKKLDYGAPPPGYALHGSQKWSITGTTRWGENGTDEASASHTGLTRAWCHYKLTNDPPEFDRWYFLFANSIACPYSDSATLDERTSAVRAAAWLWYDCEVMAAR